MCCPTKSVIKLVSRDFVAFSDLVTNIPHKGLRVSLKREVIVKTLIFKYTMCAVQIVNVSYIKYCQALCIHLHVLLNNRAQGYGSKQEVLSELNICHSSVNFLVGVAIIIIHLHAWAVY